MRTPAQLVDDLVAARRVVERLRLPLGAQAWKGQAGEFRGAGVGSSIDFQDHRDYAPGDDPRHINWQAFARTGQYSLKLYREDVRPVIDLLVDVSQSMWAEPEKAQRPAELLYFFTLSAQRSGASLQVHFLNGDASRPVSLEAIWSDRWVEEIELLSPTSATAPPQLVEVRTRANAIRAGAGNMILSMRRKERGIPTRSERGFWNGIRRLMGGIFRSGMRAVAGIGSFSHGLQGEGSFSPH